MSADVATVATEPLTKVDSAIEEGHGSPIEKSFHRRRSSTISGVFNINELEKEGADIQIAIETQKLGWKLNSSPSTVEDKEVLKKMLTTPPLKRIDLHFPLGLEVTARNIKGVTIKDALDAIYKQFKKKSDDEFDAPYLAGFEWDREECYTRFIVHQKKTGEVQSSGGSSKKNKKKNKDEE